MPIYYSFVNFRFFFFFYNFLSSVCSIVVLIKFCFCSTQYYSDFSFEEFFSKVFHFDFKIHVLLFMLCIVMIIIAVKSVVC